MDKIGYILSKKKFLEDFGYCYEEADRSVIIYHLFVPFFEYGDYFACFPKYERQCERV